MFVVKIRFRINHLLQEVEQVDGHTEVDGIHWLEEVEGLDVRIEFNSYNLLLILKTDLKRNFDRSNLPTKVMKNVDCRLTLIG
jgi:hypothetical protein